VSIVAPRETDMLYGVVDLVADAACPEGESAASVAFRVDGTPAGERTSPPWTVTWNAGGHFASHLVEARLTDRRGGRTSSFVLTPGAALTETVLVASTPIDLVELSVSVTDPEGQPVRGLVRDDFVVEEEGRIQHLGEAHREDRPLSIAVLLDASSSVKAYWPQLAAAAPALARALRRGDAVKVVAFNGPAYMVQDFTTDPGRVQRSIDRFQAWGGGTSLYDTLAAVGTELAWGRSGRQAVVLITDGIDTLSRIDAPRLRNYLRRTDVVVETFLVPPDGGGAAAASPRFRRDMGSICRDTGGTLRPLRTLDGLTDAFRDLGESLQDRYYLSYQSDQAAREGWRSIQVRVPRDGVTVRARRWVIGSRPVGGFLLAEMKSRDSEVRRKAAEWLGTMPAEGAGEALLRALSDRSVPVREAAAVALGRIREPRAIDPLIDLLDERDLGLRDAAARGLHSFGPAAVPALLSALDRDQDRFRIELLDVLAEIGDARAV
jgi:VWFA-related protein